MFSLTPVLLLSGLGCSARADLLVTLNADHVAMVAHCDDEARPNCGAVDRISLAHYQLITDTVGRMADRRLASWRQTVAALPFLLNDEDGEYQTWRTLHRDLSTLTPSSGPLRIREVAPGAADIVRLFDAAPRLPALSAE